MQNLSNDIEQYILERLQEEADENFISLRRKELAEMFECVPSQINYVLRSRFSPAHGYLIESRRGEYGYIKILKVSLETPQDKSKHIRDLIGNEITLRSAERLLEALQERELITSRERLLIDIALRNVYGPVRTHREKIYAEILKKMLGGLMITESEEEY